MDSQKRDINILLESLKGYHKNPSEAQQGLESLAEYLSNNGTVYLSKILVS